VHVDALERCRSPHLDEQLRLDYLAAELFADFAAQAVQRRFTGLWLAARRYCTAAGAACLLTSISADR
jgi:hypothetical protein